VNSKFTQATYRSTFRVLAALTSPPEVLYPCVEVGKEPADKLKKPVFLSLNRFERKKDLALAIRALALVKGKCSLILSGGHDPRVSENVEYAKELKDLAASLGVADRVEFSLSPSDAEKADLLQKSFALLYTPTNEHFGIVPLEAMCARIPVIATATGGPLETVVDFKTGRLVQPDAASFAEAMSELLGDPEAARKMGSEGRKRVIEHFSRAAFGKRLGGFVETSDQQGVPLRVVKFTLSVWAVLWIPAALYLCIALLTELGALLGLY
jgi:alpha-1,3/alpha-1,6-mannosyltransferase